MDHHDFDHLHVCPGCEASWGCGLFRCRRSPLMQCGGCGGDDESIPAATHAQEGEASFPHAIERLVAFDLFIEGFLRALPVECLHSLLYRVGQELDRRELPGGLAVEHASTLVGVWRRNRT